MAEIKTESGFKAKILDEATDNWELLEAFRAIDRGETGAIVDVAPLLLGEKQVAALKEHLRNKNGIVLFKISESLKPFQLFHKFSLVS